MTRFFKNALAVSKVALARLRFLAVFLAAALIVGYWDSMKNHLDKWTRPPVAPDALAHSDVEYYCVMHPNVIRAEPGSCPICGMPLAKRKKGEKAELPAQVMARLQLTPRRIALAGIAVSPVVNLPLQRHIRALGMLDYDETRVARLAARVPGRADTLQVRFAGQKVQRGDPVYSVYSPELYTAQREYLLARKRIHDLPADTSDDMRHDATEIYNAAMQKLVLWGATPEQLDAMEAAFDKTGKIPNNFQVTSPLSGIVVKKSLYEGGYVQAGEAPYTIADLTTLWLQAQIYEADIPMVHLGQSAQILIDGQDRQTFTGTITFLAFQVDPTTRTLAARIQVENPELKLKPGMFAEARLEIALSPKAPATSAPANETALPPRPQAQKFSQALVPYFHAAELLADDKAQGVSDDLHKLLNLLEPLKEEKTYTAEIDEIEKAVHATMSADLPELRTQFRLLSDALIKIGLKTGVTQDSLKIYRCPMGPKPYWIQAAGETRNPYMGHRMLTCGGPVDTLPQAKPAAAPATTPPSEKLLAVPREAVIDTGSQKVVFVASPEAEGVFDMKALKTGPIAQNAQGQEFYPVYEGVQSGDRVVSRGAFLLDAENRLNPQ